MSNEITTQKQYQTSQEIELNTEDVKQYIAPNATDQELYFFMNIAKSFGLDPFRREIHFVKYQNQPGQTIVGYEVYLKRAERTGLLDGWSVHIDKDNIGEKAVIQIHRKDRSYPFQWEVYRREFDRQQSTWKTMPYFMLRKVAISQGFRLAFPEEIGGMPYTFEETPTVNEIDNQTEEQSQSQNMTYLTPTQKQLGMLNHQLQILGMHEREERIQMVNAWLENHGYEMVNSSKEISRQVMSDLISGLQRQIEEQIKENNSTNNNLENMDEFYTDQE